MNRSDAANFEEDLTATMELYGKPAPSTPAMRRWWSALQSYPLAVVLRAFSQHERLSKFAPKPADIIEIINSQDGRIDSDEAWAIALTSMDESETVIWTEEIAQARAAALPIYTAGDKVGARMAFKERYKTLVARAREIQIPVKWSITLGHVVEKRTAALDQAIALNRITRQQAERAYLPAPEITGQGVAIAGLLTNEGHNVHALEKLNGIRTLISKAEQREAEQKEKQNLEREEKRQDFENHKKQQVAAAQKKANQ